MTSDTLSRFSSAGTTAGVLAVLIWSMAAPVIASAVGMDPFLYVAYGDAISAAVFLLKWVVLRQNPLPELRRIPLWFYALGLVGISVHGLTWVAALRQAPALEATLIIYTWPLLVVVFTTMFRGERFRWYHIAGGLLGLAGIATMLMGRGLRLEEFQLTLGHLWAVISALSWSVFAAVSSRYKDRSSDFFGVVFFFSALVSGSVWLALGAPPAPTQSLWIAGVAAVLFATGYALYDFGTKKGNAQLIGVISFLTPVLAAFYLVLLGQAELTASLALSLVLVVAGIGIAKYGGGLRRVAAA